MRKFLAGLVAVSLLVAPTFGATIDVKILVNGSANPTLAPGAAATVEGWFKCNSTTEAVCAIGGSVTASGPGLTVTGTPLAVSTFFQAAPYYFQGFQPLLGQPSTSIPAATPLAGSNGDVSNIGSAQGMQYQGTAQWFRIAEYGMNNWVKLFSYNVQAANVSSTTTVTLTWAEAAAGGNNGWYTTDTGMVNGVNVNTPAVVTISAPVTAANLLTSSIDYTVTARKTWSRTKNNYVLLTFDKDLVGADIPVAGDITIQQMTATAGVYGADKAATWTWDVINNASGQPRVLRLRDTSNTTGVLTDLTWYSIRSTGNSRVAAFEKKAPVVTMDGNGDGNVTSGDVSLARIGMAPNLGSVVTGDITTARYDLDGSGTITSADITLSRIGRGMTLTPPW